MQNISIYKQKNYNYTPYNNDYIESNDENFSNISVLYIFQITDILDDRNKM